MLEQRFKLIRCVTRITVRVNSKENIPTRQFYFELQQSIYLAIEAPVRSTYLTYAQRDKTVFEVHLYHNEFLQDVSWIYPYLLNTNVL